MENDTELIPVLVTKEEKETIAKRAHAAGIDVAQFMRQAAALYDPREEALLVAAMEELNRLSDRTCTVVDDMLAFVDASNERMAALDARQQAGRI